MVHTIGSIAAAQFGIVWQPPTAKPEHGENKLLYLKEQVQMQIQPSISSQPLDYCNKERGSVNFHHHSWL